MQTADLLILNDGFAVNEEGVRKRRRADGEHVHAVDLQIFAVFGVTGVRTLNINRLHAVLEQADEREVAVAEA